MTSSLEDATEEFASFTQMIRERQPALAPRIDAIVADMVAEMEDTFRPYTDLAEGRITEGEFVRIIAAREAADIERREQEYGDEGPWVVMCNDCGEEFETDDLPSMYPQHSDIGILCVEDDDDDRPET
jgi:hypothetical protein